ncbi:MAG TPA: ASKHA domain-containing protein [Bacillota bacterium]
MAVTFLPGAVSMTVPNGIDLLEAAASVGLDLSGDCGGQGTCEKCRVRVVEGEVSAPSEAEIAALGPDLAAGWRLACQTRVLGATKVEIGQPISETWRKGALARLSAGARLLDSGIDRSGLDPSGQAFSVAVDIGTTTVVATLLDLGTGRPLATSTATNAQNVYGADVISRITHAIGGERGTAELQEKVIGVINGLLGDLGRRAGVPTAKIRSAAVVGNATMIHLFLGVRPDGLSRAPYEAAFTAGRTVDAGSLGLDLAPSTEVHVLPGIASFLGADTVGVVLATRLAELPGWSLALDIGTNGELVLAGDGRLWACSTAAGPAFEGAQIGDGMRAAAGAIERVSLGPGDRNDKDLHLQVIGGGPPAGICGSGLIDAVAVLLAAGALDASGRLSGPSQPADVPPAIGERVVADPDGPAFILAESGADGRRVRLTQTDIRQLQLGKAAIRAGVQLLLKEVGLEEARLDRILLAGAFGNYIDPTSARRIGLLPNIPLERITPVGNAAGVGAELAALSRTRRREAEELARRIEHVPLAERPEFQSEFIKATRFDYGV